METTEDRQILVSNLSEKLNEDILKDFFSYCGTIQQLTLLTSTSSDKALPPVIDSRVTSPEQQQQRSLSTNSRYLIQFSKKSEAETALKLDGTSLMGSELKVSLARDEHPADYELQVSAKALVFNEQQSKYRSDSTNRTIFVSNLHSQISTIQLVEFFSVCGPISYLRLSAEEGTNPRCGFVEFLEASSLKLALVLSGTQIGDRAIRVFPSRHAIVKPPVRLNKEEQEALREALKDIRRILRQKYPERFKGEEKEVDRSSEDRHHKHHHTTHDDDPYHRSGHYYGDGNRKRYSDDRWQRDFHQDERDRDFNTSRSHRSHDEIEDNDRRKKPHYHNHR